MILWAISFLVNFWLGSKKLFPAIKVTKIPINNSTLGDKGQTCFYVDIKNEEIEKLTEVWGNLKTIVAITTGGEAVELIIDHDDAVLNWDVSATLKIDLDGSRGHAKLKIVEEGSFLDSDALFIRFMTRTTKDTKLKLQPSLNNKFIADLYLEIELNGFYIQNMAYPFPCRILPYLL